MAFSLDRQHSLPPDVQENIIHNIQKTFPKFTNEGIRCVLNHQRWDLEKSLSLLKKSVKQGGPFPKQPDSKKKSAQGKTKSLKNTSSGSNINSIPPKPPRLLKNFKKKNDSIKVVENGDWVILEKKGPQHSTTDVSGTKGRNPFSADIKPLVTDDKLAKKKKTLQHYELIRQFGEPLNRITAYIHEGIRVMIILRGCSGSGKSTYAQQLLKKYGGKNNICHIYSTDNFFTDKDGKYVFYYELLQLAHEWNQKMVRIAVSEGRSPIFIDNTNTRIWEMKEYAMMAVENGYVVETLEPPTPWFFNEEMLFRKTLHNVPRESIKKMLDRYEANVSGDDVLRTLKLSYGSQAPPQRAMSGPDQPLSKKQSKMYQDRLGVQLSSNNRVTMPITKKYNKPDSLSSRDRPKPNSFVKLENKSFVNHVPESNNFRRIHEIGRVEAPKCFPDNSNVNVNKLMGPCQPFVQNQQMFFSPYSHFPTNGPVITSAVPGTFNPQFHESVYQQNYNRSNFPQQAGLGMFSETDHSVKETTLTSTPSYTEDLIDLTIPAYITPSSIDSSENDLPPNEISSSVSLLEGLTMENLESEDSNSDENEEMENRSSSECDESEESFTNNSSLLQDFNFKSVQEYVLISTDGSVVFQKFHQDLADVKTIEDFKKTSSNSSSIFANSIDNLLSQFMEYSGSIFGDHFNLRNNVSEEENIKSISETVGSGKFEDASDVSLHQKEIPVAVDIESHPEACIGNWDYTKELPNEFSSITPKDQREKFPEAMKKTFLNSIPTNTNYLDFEILREVNNGAFIDEVNIIKGNAGFTSGVCEILKKPASVLMLHKGTMTSGIETSRVTIRENGVNRLLLMFPTVPRENLEELFDKCQKDIDWTAGVLLDSGHVMSELFTSFDAIECSNYDDIASSISPGSSGNKDSEDAHQEEIKKQKKKKNILLDSSECKEIQEQLRSNFVLDERHYSEKMKKFIERKRNIQIGLPIESSSTFLPTDEVLEEVNANGNEQMEGSETEEETIFMLDTDLIFQLQSRFGGLLRPNMIAEKTVVSIPSSLARQLHSYVMDSVLQQIEGEDIFADDTTLSKDEDLARSLQNEELKARGVKLNEIMDEEVALRKSLGQKDSNSGRSMASTLSKQLLIERFPLMDPATLASILEDTNHSLHEATCLLSSAGHSPCEPKDKADESGTVEILDKTVLSREEAIKQAEAYGDVAAKLYELRKDCLKKSQNAYREGNHSVALYYSDMARWYMERIEKSNSLAAKAILSGYEGWTTLDLHFLQVSEALNVLDLFVDEVIRRLQESNGKKKIVYIITGRGLHSTGGRSRLKPAVQSRLLKRDLRYVEQNPGMLKVTIPKTACLSYNREVAVRS